MKLFFFVSEEILSTVSGFLSTDVAVVLDDVAANIPRVVVSSGYPFYYPIGAVSTWTISSPPETYLNLLFSNISLNQYKVRITEEVQNIRFLHTGKGYLTFYPGIENLILPMLSYQGCYVRATYIGCIGTHAHGHQVTSLLC